MIIVYDSKETNFNNNGLIVLNECISCAIVEELNGQYELNLEYPLLDNQKTVGVITPIKIVGQNLVGEVGIQEKLAKWQHLLEGNIIKADGQLFRIYHKFKTLNSIKINARHIFYDLLDNFLEDVTVANLSGSAALDWVLTHTQYTHPFTNMSDIGGNNTKHIVRKNPVEEIMGKDGIIATYGGEIVRDNFIIKLLGARGLDRGTLIAYGKNIQGIEETLDTDGMCTRLMPIGKDALMLPEKYIDSQYINNYPHPKIKTQEFSDIGIDTTLGITEAMAIVLLRAAATSHMENGKIDIPQFNYKIDFLELSKTEEYRNYAVLERVHLGDTVTIKHSKLNINLKAKVIKTTKNILTDRLENIELGSFKPNLATGIDTAIQDVKQDIINGKSEWQKAVDNATNLINTSLGGYVVKKAGEILIMDTEDEMTATKVWRWNLNGLGYSSTGYAGPFALAMTMDGQIVASFIYGLLGEFVQIRASQIILGEDNGKIPDGLIEGSSGWNYASDVADQALIDASNAQNLANTANSILTQIASDDWLTPVEKQSVKKEWDIIVAEKPILDNQADFYQITTEKADYDYFYAALSSYIVPLLADLTSTLSINGYVFRSMFAYYYQYRTILLNAIANVTRAIAQGSVQPNTSYNSTYITSNGLQVKDSVGGEVVTLGALGSGLYGLKVKNAFNSEVTTMGKVGSGTYGIKSIHSDGSYTQLTENGLERFVNGESHPYHYETYIISGTTAHPTGYGDMDKFTLYETDSPTPTYFTNGINVQLPARFNNKDFKAFVVYSGGIMNHAFAKSDTYVVFKVNSINQANATVNVVGYATSYWNNSEDGYYWDYADDTISTFGTDWRARRTNGLDFTLIVTL